MFLLSYLEESMLGFWSAGWGYICASGGGMLYSEGEIEELDDGTLGIAASAVLAPLSASVTFIVEDAVGQTGYGHVFATGEEGSDLVIEHLGIAVLVHSLEKNGNIIDAVCEDDEILCY